MEDPAEAFEDLRDRNDLRMLLKHERFINEAFGPSKGTGKIGPPAEKGWVEKWRRDLKIAGVCLLYTLSPLSEAEVKSIAPIPSTN